MLFASRRSKQEKRSLRAGFCGAMTVIIAVDGQSAPTQPKSSAIGEGPGEAKGEQETAGQDR
jgi:hypothetical protein